MNSSAAANVTAEIFALTRSQLDTPDAACGPFISFQSVLDAMDLFRICRVSEFWRDANGNVDPYELFGRVEDVVGGWHGQHNPWAFLIRGNANAIECGFGVVRKAVDRYSTLLIGGLPGITLDTSWKPFADGWEPSAVESLSVTGVPTRKSEAIDKLCRGFYGQDWAYMVYAHPISRKDTRVQSLAFESRTSEIQQAFLYKDAVPNRMAERLIEMMERQTKRFEIARSVGMWNVHTVLAVQGNAGELSTARGLALGAFAGKKSTPEPFRVRQFAGSSTEANTWTQLTGHELASLVTLPLEDHPGFEVVPDTRFGVQPVVPTRDVAVDVGEVLDRGRATGNRVMVAMRDLTKHGLVVGVTGSGKTNTCFELLAQIWRSGEGVPFMVLESAKSEYRDLLNDPRFEGLRVFTIGNETVAPLRLNPFEVAPGTLIQSHIDYLKALFSAAFVLYPPMPYVLDQALHEIYEDYGWDLATNENRRGAHGASLFPTLDDLVDKTRAVVKSLGYDSRLEMDVQAGLTARLDSLRRGGGKGPMLNTRVSVSDADLFEHPCVLELTQIVSDDEKAFFIGLLLIKLHEYYESQPLHRHDGGLRHVTLIEEAHRLLRNVSTEQGSDVSANPKGQAIEVFSNMLAEIRAFGEGMLIAEQVPTKLIPDAIKNTNLKIVHRLVSADDREVIGKTMNLDDEQNAFLTTLRTGEAVSYTEGASKPTRVQVGLAAVKRSGGRVDGSAVRDAMGAFYQERDRLRFPYAMCTNCPGRDSRLSCGGSQRIDDVATRLAKRVILALRFGDPGFHGFYASYCDYLRKSAQGIEPHCTLAAVIAKDLTERGRRYGWSEAQLAFLESSVASAITQCADSSDADRLAAQFARLESRRGPYNGCDACNQPCRFLVEMSASNGREFQDAYHNAFRASSKAFEERWKDGPVAIALHHAQRHFTDFDDDTVRSAAYCFGVQQLHKINSISEEESEVVMRALRKGLGL